MIKHMPSKFLSIFKPLCRVMPEVKQPDREVSFKEKFFWTAIVLVIYLVMSVIPLYGMTTSGGQDPFYWLRVILASTRGSLTELGIGPIVTGGLIMQLLQGSKLIKVDLTDPEDRALFTGAQKVMTILLTIFQILAYLYAGAFGTIGAPVASGGITITDAIEIFLQLLAGRGRYHHAR